MPSPFEIKSFNPAEELGDVQDFVKFASYHWESLKWGFTGNEGEEKALGNLLKEMDAHNKRWIVLPSPRLRRVSTIVAPSYLSDPTFFDNVIELREKGYVEFRNGTDGSTYATVAPKTFFDISSALQTTRVSRRIPMNPDAFVKVVEAFRNERVA